MPTTAQMLNSYPEILLEVMAELRGAYLESAETREQKIELLAAQVTEPTYVQMAFEEVGEGHPQSDDAIESLLQEGGEMREAKFSREFGGIRQMGPARLERETPWFAPDSVAEVLYYYGLIGRGFKGAGQDAHTIIYIPTDVIPWLPHRQNPALNDGLPVHPVAPPPAARVLPTEDAFLEDTGTMLGFLLTERLRLTPDGPHPEDVDRLVERLQMPFGDMPDLNVRLALLLHVANRMGFLRRYEDGSVGLTKNRVRVFLEKTHAEQRFDLWEAWRLSPDWNDLCRTPGLECSETGNWSNDPTQTRDRVLQLLQKLQPGAWYSQAEVIEAIKQTEPDFQRPTGDYDTWYIRSTSTEEFLKGFGQWESVEGALLRFLFRGPLHWLHAMDLAEPSAGDDVQLSLSQWGSYWLDQDSSQPHDSPRRPMVVDEEFTVHLPNGTPLADRFHVERFAQWRASYPHYSYQISQRSLKRATEEGIMPDRIVEFFRGHTRSLPSNVANAVIRFGTAERVT